MAKLIITTLLFCIITLSWAQVPEVKWKVNNASFSFYENYLPLLIEKISANEILEVGGLDTWFTKNYNPLNLYSSFEQNGCTTQIFLRKPDGKLLASAYFHGNDISFSAIILPSNDLMFFGSGAGYNAPNEKNLSISRISKVELLAQTTQYGYLQATWTKRYGGTSDDYGYATAQSRQGQTYWVAGLAASSDGDITTGNKGKTDSWLVQIDSMGNLLRSKTYGGSEADTAYALTAFAHGLLVAGTTTSNNGDVSGNHGGQDAWMYKTDTSGVLQWQKTIGGSGDDVFTCMVYDSLSNSVYYGGYSSSNDGDVTGNHGGHDLWVVKTDTIGVIMWSKLFGGTSDEAAMQIKIAPQSGNLLLSGFTYSADGDISRNYGDADAWTLMLDSNGNKIWEKTIGNKLPNITAPVSYLSPSDFVIAPNTYTKTERFNTQVYNSNSSMFRLGSANPLMAYAVVDTNRNGLPDLQEPPFNRIMIAARSGIDSVFAKPESGVAYLGLDTGMYQITATPFDSNYTVSPPYISKSFSNYYQKDTVRFAVSIPTIHRDLELSVVANTTSRPGFNTRFSVYYANNGVLPSGTDTILLIKDPRLEILSSNPAYASLVGDTLIWYLNNLASDESGTIVIDAKVAAPPATANGDTLKLTATISSVDMDNNPANNRFTLRQVVQGSYDPNDKQEAYGGKITEEQMTQNNRIYYTIRFQNTGTDTAFNVVLRDTLSAKLNPVSLQILGASHDYRMQVASGNQLTFYFDNILLPDSNRNLVGSNGYVSFSISPYAVPKAGDTLSNKAAIYFDYNLPVITNTSKLLITKVQGSACAGSDVLFNAGYPNASNWQWQQEAEEGAGFVNISNNAMYSGTSSNQLRVIEPATNTSGYRYRCLLTVNGKQIPSEIFTLRFVNQWKGTVSTAWELAANWSCGQVPDTHSDVFIPLNTPFRPEISVSTQVRKATVEAGSLLSVKSGVVLIIGNFSEPN